MRNKAIEKLSEEERFEYFAMPVTESGCWLWTGHIGNRHGYALLHFKGKPTLAHRWAYEKYRGPIPSGLQIDHLCRVRSCVNPWHLETVTIKENVLRGESVSAINKRKVICLNGHALDGDNLRVDSDGARNCRTCRRERQIRNRARKREVHHAQP